MNIEQELADARAEMIFREEQMHSPMVRGTDDQACYLAGLVAHEYDAARDRYLALLAEDRIRKLADDPEPIQIPCNNCGTISTKTFCCGQCATEWRALREYNATHPTIA